MCKISAIESRQPKHSGKVQQQRYNDRHPTKLNKEDADRAYVKKKIKEMQRTQSISF